jgi:probable blue pigment (indigoidine) exporter
MRDIILTALAPLLWGTTYFVTTQLLPPNRPLFVALIRALPVGLLLLTLNRRLPSGVWWWRALALGALNIGIFFALLFIAAYRLPGGVVATLMAMQPFLVALLAWVFLTEHPALRTFIAAFFGMLGVGLIVFGPIARFDRVGVIAGMAATLAMATGTVLTKRWGRSAPLLVFTSWQLVAGGLMLLPVSLAIEGIPPMLTTKNLLGFAWLGIVGTGIAYALWFRGIRNLKASTVAFLGLLSPIAAMLLDFLLLKKTITTLQIVGAALVFGGIFLSQPEKRRDEGATR